MPVHRIRQKRDVIDHVCLWKIPCSINAILDSLCAQQQEEVFELLQKEHWSHSRNGTNEVTLKKRFGDGVPKAIDEDTASDDKRRAYVTS